MIAPLSVEPVAQVVARDQFEVGDPAVGGVAQRAHLRGVDRRLHVDLGDPRLQVVDRLVDAVGAAGPPVVVEVVGEDDPLLGGQLAERESRLLGA